MNVAKAFKDKPAIIADLPLIFVYRLVAPSTPETIRKRVIVELEAGKRIDCMAVVREINQSRQLLTHSPSRSAVKLPGKRKKTDRVEIADHQEEEQAERADRLQEEADAREVIAILARLADVDLRRLSELLKKTSVWRSFRDLVDQVADEASARAADHPLDIPPELDRRAGRVCQEAIEE